MRKSQLVVLAVLVMLPIQNSWSVGSGGFTNQVVGTKALGMGNTFVATADDPSAIYFNPAGITQLQEPNISLGLAPIKSNTKYTATNGATDSTEGVTPVVPNLYATVPFHEGKWVFGFGINSPFGLETHWADDSPLRYEATDSKLQLVNLNPTLAYQINEKISVGGGIAYGLTSAKLESKINESALNSFLNGSPTSSPDGNKTLEGDGQAWGYNFGVLYKPLERHSLGLSYRSELKTQVKGKTKLSGLSGTSSAVFGGSSYEVDTKTDINYPDSLLLGYAYKPEKWTFAVDAEWVGYSSIKENKLTFSGESDATRLAILNTGNPIPRDWHNTWNLGLGTNYKFNETWQARGGYFYYPQAIPTANWEPGNPESSRNGFTLGGSYSKPSYTVDLAYNLIKFNDRNINNMVGATNASTVNGKYETTAHIVSANFTYRFNTKS